MMNSCQIRPPADLLTPPFFHDVYENIAGYCASDISSFFQVFEKAKVTGSCRSNRGAEKKDVKMKVYATMLMKTMCRKIKHSDFATML